MPTKPSPSSFGSLTRTFVRTALSVFGALVCVFIVQIQYVRATPQSTSVAVGSHVDELLAHGKTVIIRRGPLVQAYRWDAKEVLWGVLVGDRPALGDAILNGSRNVKSILYSNSYVYSLSETALHVISAGNGQIISKIAVISPTGMIYESGTIYVSDKSGVRRFNATGNKLLGKTAVTGDLEAAHGSHILIYRQEDDLEKSHKINALSVISLKNGKIIYRFKLITPGGHKILRFSKSQLTFLDYSKRTGPGDENPRKIYFTEVDVKARKKLRDIDLSTYYEDAERDGFDAIYARKAHRLIVANYYNDDAASADPKMHSQEIDNASTVFAYDTQKQQILWKRAGSLISSAPLKMIKDHFVSQSVDNTTTGRSNARLVSYRIIDGSMSQSVRLTGVGHNTTWDVSKSGLAVVDGTNLRFFSSSLIAPDISVIPTQLKTGRLNRGWVQHRNNALGYALQLPKQWQLEETETRHWEASNRHVVVYGLYEWIVERQRWIYISSLHVLIRPAGKQNSAAVCSAVRTQRARLSSQLQWKGSRAIKVGNRRGTQSKYRFRGGRRRGGQSILTDARSLCTVSQGLAYELRARIGRHTGREIWAEISKIFKTFRVAH